MVAVTVSGGIGDYRAGDEIWCRKLAPEAFGHASRWPFFLFYAITLGLVGIGQLLLRHVREAQALPTDRFVRALLVDWPQRMWDDLRR